MPNPAMSINDQKDLNELFYTQLHKKFPSSDPSVLAEEAYKDLRVLKGCLDELETVILHTVYACYPYADDPVDTVSRVIEQTKDELRDHFENFHQQITVPEHSLISVLNAFDTSHMYKIDDWLTDLTEGIEKINKNLINVKFEFNRKETSLAKIVKKFTKYLREGKGDDPRTYPIKDAIAELRKTCSKT